MVRVTDPTPRRRGTARLAATLLALGLSLAACSSPAPTTAAAPSSTPAAAAVDVPAVSVTVSEAGAEPRAVLALAPGGEPQRVTLTTAAGIVQRIGGQEPVDLSSPEVSLPLTATTTAGEPTDRVAVVLGTPTSPDAILADALVPEAGSTADLEVAPSAAVTALAITPAPDALDTARSAVEQALRQAVQLAVALPADPVGVGARWTVSQQLDSLGLPLRQDVTATLTARDGDRVTLALALAQTPLANLWTVPGGGGTFSVDSYPMQGTGEVTLDLGAPLPTAGELSLTGTQVYTRQADSLVLSQDVTNRVGWATP